MLINFLLSVVLCGAKVQQFFDIRNTKMQIFTQSRENGQKTKIKLHISIIFRTFARK